MCQRRPPSPSFQAKKNDLKSKIQQLWRGHLCSCSVVTQRRQEEICCVGWIRFAKTCHDVHLKAQVKQVREMSSEILVITGAESSVHVSVRRGPCSFSAPSNGHFGVANIEVPGRPSGNLFLPKEKWVTEVTSVWCIQLIHLI